MKEYLTLIIPVYKIKELYLRECIESIINQNHSGCKVLLIDDGSPDHCGKICDEYARNNDFIQVIHQKNQGVSVARNMGLDHTFTKWVAFVDADDWLPFDYFDILRPVLFDHEVDQADILMFDYVREFKGKRNRETLGLPNGLLDSNRLQECRRALFYKLKQDGKYNPYTVIGLWDKVYKTEFINKNGLRFDREAKKGQDRLFNAEALNATNCIYYLSRECYHYRCWEESRTNRFDPNIIGLTKIEILALQNTMKKYGLEGKYMEDLNCRICTRLYTCMRLYYFHSLNKTKYAVVRKEILELTENAPFSDALRMVNLSMLSSAEKLFVLCIRLRWIGLLSVLVRIKSGLMKRKLT